MVDSLPKTKFCVSSVNYWNQTTYIPLYSEKLKVEQQYNLKPRGSDLVGLGFPLRLCDLGGSRHSEVWILISQKLNWPFYTSDSGCRKWRASFCNREHKALGWGMQKTLTAFIKGESGDFVLHRTNYLRTCCIILDHVNCPGSIYCLWAIYWKRGC